MIYLFRKTISLWMWKDFDNEKAKEWWDVLTHDSNSFAKFTNINSNIFSITISVGLLKDNLPQLQSFSILDFSDKFWIVIISVFDFFLVQIFRNQFDSSFRIVQSFNIFVESIINMSESFFTWFWFCFECLNHFIQQSDFVFIEFWFFVDYCSLLFMSKFSVLFVQSWYENFLRNAMSFSIILFHDGFLEVFINFRIK